MSLWGPLMLMLFVFSSHRMAKANIPFEYFHYYNLVERGQCSALTSDNGTATISNLGGILFLFTKTDKCGVMTLQRHVFETSFSKLTLELHEMKQTSDGGFIVTGWFGSTSANLDIFLLKLNAQGIPTWGRQFDRPFREYAYSVTELNDGGFALTGEISDGVQGTNDIVVIRTNSMGSTIWERYYHEEDTDEGGRSIIQASDGHLVVTGYRDSLNSDKLQDVNLMKVNLATGNVMWYRFYGDTLDEIGLALRQSPTGELAVTGNAKSWNISGDAFLLQVNPNNGNLIRFTTYGGDLSDEGRSIEPVGVDGYIIAGWSSSFSQAWFQNTEYFTVRVQNDGTPKWAKIYGGPIFDYCEDVHVAIDAPKKDTSFRFFGSVTWAGQAVGYLVGADKNGNADCNYQDIFVQYEPRMPDVGSCNPYVVTDSTNKPYVWAEADTPDRDYQLCQNPMLGNDFEALEQGAVAKRGAAPNLQGPKDERVEVLTYPNPVADQLHIQLETVVEGDWKAELYAQDGRLLVSKRINGNDRHLVLPLQELPAGTYLLRTTYDGVVVSKKILKH